ncbi:MAG TPA: HAD hydrolase family protein [Syntrophorhabdaceae bacterium]|jgi:3-deoxy-D-manno-octulosonate 8-phosphate phosphatase (KDO 8-P phosphatase)
MEFQKDVENARERARKVKLFGHDIHGTLTANTLFCDIEGNRRYGFWHMDGFGDLSLSANEIRIAYLDTTSIDGEGLFRAKELKLDKFYYSITDKAAKLEEIRKEMDITDSDIGYLGSELSDLPIMKKVGFPVATADAADEVKAVACYVTNAPGGRGAMRETCEFILRAMDKWEGWVFKVTKMGYK